MSFFDNNLLRNETLRYKGKMHWSYFIGPAVVSFLALPALFSSEGFAPTLLGLGVMWGYYYMHYTTTEIGVTTKRVMGKKGILRHESFETLLIQMEGLNMNQSLLGRILNYGSIHTSGTGGKPIVFSHITDPLAFRKALNEEIEQAHATLRNPQANGAAPQATPPPAPNPVQ